MVNSTIPHSSHTEQRPAIGADWRTLTDDAEEILAGDCSLFQTRRMEYLLDNSGVPKYFRKAKELSQEVVKYTAKKGIQASYYLLGPTKVGKTHAVCAIIQQLAAHHIAARIDFKALFISTPTLFLDLRRSFNSGKGNPVPGDSMIESEQQIIEKLATTPFLFLDDIGAEKPSEYTKSVFYTIINHRFNEGKHLTVTSNITPSRLSGAIGDRCASRINEMCQMIHLRNKRG